MKQIAISIALTLIVGLSFGQDDSKFEKFKTGTFKYASVEADVIIIRTPKKQTESWNDGKSQLTEKIEWVNDSTYILTHVKAINAPGCLKKGDQIKSVIIAVDGNTYGAQFTSENCGSGTTSFIKLE